MSEFDPLVAALDRMEFRDGAFHVDGLRFADDEDWTEEHARVAAEVGIIIEERCL